MWRTLFGALLYAMVSICDIVDDPSIGFVAAQKMQDLAIEGSM
jgi:hypothetical protein